MDFRFGLLKVLLLLTVIFLLPAGIHAQTYPMKPVRIIVPFPAGANSDTTIRLFAPKLTEALGQQFIVDNRVGAAGNVGAEAAARAAPDGYTLLVAPASLACSRPLYKNLPFDLERDFAPIAMLTVTPFVLIVHPSLPVKNLTELVAFAKARPGQLNYASTGIGGINHVASELFNSMAGVDIVHVPYKGTSDALRDLIGGRVSVMFSAPMSALPQVKAGRLRALTITSAKRSRVAPDLPTAAEAGLPGYEAGTWFALLAPRGTPREIVTRLNALFANIAERPEIRDRFVAEGAELPGGAPDQVGAFLRSEMTKWEKVVISAGMRAE